MNVKSNYGIKRNWQGDPCIPLSYMWDGVNCSYAGSSSPRIIYLNLSSSGLTGNIASAISNLKSIGYLDLSNNSLTGSVPYFLSQLHSLKVLNLEGNQLTGAVPMQLRENSNNGMLKTSFGGNQGLCYSGSCSNSNKVVVPLVASLGGGFVILATAITSFLYSKDIETFRQAEVLRIRLLVVIITVVEIEGGFLPIPPGLLDPLPLLRLCQ
nr:probable LRR receptor-like serine/threonine-protein kinase At1g05700 [Arachis hypogaea]